MQCNVVGRVYISFFSGNEGRVSGNKAIFAETFQQECFEKKQTILQAHSICVTRSKPNVKCYVGWPDKYGRKQHREQYLSESSPCSSEKKRIFW